MKRLFLILISCTLLTCSGCVTAESNDKLERQLNQAKAQLAKEKASVAQLKTEVLEAEKRKYIEYKAKIWSDATTILWETLF
ncbi:MAG: hypothetical protein IKW49_01955 [Opitutales bacterium]|nr:hypothetical protein [Opitutales bacterium]